MKQTAPVSTAIVFVLALNLRPAVTSLGAALEDVSLAPGMTAAVGAVLVALPLWASGIGGWITPWLKARIGIHRAVTWALVILGISLVMRVQNGAQLLIAGTALACLAIAVVGTVLPVLVQPASSRTKASFTLALGTGSTIGALVTPTVVAAFSWQFALAAWALLAVVAVNMWQRAPRSSMVFMARALNPRQLFHSRVAWHLTLYFGLVSTLTFLIMGWLPAILRDAGISASYAGFCLALSMAMGLPMMWLVPFGVHRMRRPGILVILLAVLNGVGVAGLLVAPAVAPWLWSAGLGLGMGGLAMALTLISVRAAGNADITTALSGMVQGLGYFIAGAGALACGLMHSATGSWEFPLIMALFVLAGQVWCGVRATRPIVVAPKPIAELEPTKPKPDLTRRNLKPAWTGEPLTNGTRVTAKSEWGPAVPDLAHSGNGTRMTTVSEPKPTTNGALVTAMANQTMGPDVTQPVSGVWVAAIADLESAKSEPNRTQLSDGAWGIASPDLERLADGAQLAALSGPQPEQDAAHLVNGVRVTASAESEADTAKSGNGVPAGAMPTPGKRERILPHLVNGVWIAGPIESEWAAAASADGAPVAASAEPDLALTNGVRVTAVSESDAVEADIWGPELVDLPGGVWVRSAAVAEHQFNGVRDAAVSRPEPAVRERDVAHLVSNGVAGSEPDAAALADGVAVVASAEPDLALSNGVRDAAVSRAEPAVRERDVAHLVGNGVAGSESDAAALADGVAVAASAEPDLVLTNGVRVTAVSESDAVEADIWGPELVDLPGGVWVRSAAVAEHQFNGVRDAAVSRPEPAVRERDVAHLVSNGVAGSEPDAAASVDGVAVVASAEPDLVLTNGVRVTAKADSEQLVNGVRVTAVSESERDAAWLVDNGVRAGAEPDAMDTHDGVRVDGPGSRLVPFTNGAGVPVPRPSERTVNGGTAKVPPDHLANGVRVTAASGQGEGSPAEPPPGLPKPVNGVVAKVPPEGPVNGVRVTAVDGQGGAAPTEPESGLSRPVNGVGPRWIPFTNGAGVPVPRQPLSADELAHAANGVRVTALDESEPDIPSQGAVAEIQLPRQRVGPTVGGTPIVQSVQPETATQEG